MHETGVQRYKLLLGGLLVRSPSPGKAWDVDMAPRKRRCGFGRIFGRRAGARGYPSPRQRLTGGVQEVALKRDVGRESGTGEASCVQWAHGAPRGCCFSGGASPTDIVLEFVPETSHVGIMSVQCLETRTDDKELARTSAKMQLLLSRTRDSSDGT